MQTVECVTVISSLKWLNDLPPAYRRFTFLKMQYIEQEFQPSLFIASYTSKGTRVHVFSLGYFAAT